MAQESFHEPVGAAADPDWTVPIRELGLTLVGSPLEPVLAEFADELVAAGIRRLKPCFYLSTEWGVNDGTIAVGIPFYLARPELVRLHEQRVGHTEGADPVSLLRYLRHEVGHVVNYAYRLHATEEWTDLFGPIDRPYLDDYTPEPWSRRFVRHLPGWYAQKHPDEDWAETFAVWLTPGLDWRAEYADWPEALRKLQYCDRTIAALAEVDPPVTTIDLDEDVSALTVSVDAFYDLPTTAEALASELPQGLPAALRDIFPWHGAADRDAAALIRRLETALNAAVYHWTGHFPERTRPLVRHLAELADTEKMTYAAEAEPTVIVGVTTLVCTLAMNHVHRGAYGL